MKAPIILLVSTSLLHALTAASLVSATREGSHSQLLIDEDNQQDTPSSGNTCPCQSENSVKPTTLQVLVVDHPGIQEMVQWNADDYFLHTNGAVKVQVKTAPSMTSLFEEIENDARAGGGLYDGYYTNPLALGTGAVLSGFHDLKPYIKSSPHVDWTDILLALRTYMTSFEDNIYLIPLDGDTLTLFYRKDILQAFGLQVPRTWNEYVEVARAVHGKVFNGTTLSGSCMARQPEDHAMYWYHMVLSTITQTNGTSEGSLFDTKDMKPLLGHAAAEMIRIHEGQVKYGAPDEFDGPMQEVQNKGMHNGSCTMTIMWGDMFRKSRASGNMLHDNLGIAPTPGSELVLNRKTGKLEPCTRELCPFAKYYEDLGFVNFAPYAANGIWGGAVSENTTPEKQEELAEFFLWASSGKQSFKYALPNATNSIDEINGQDPWRRSQLDVDRWVEKGFSRDLSSQYVQAIMHNLVSRNVVVDARFPKAAEIMNVLDEEVGHYLRKTRNGTPLPDPEAHAARMRVAEGLERRWTRIITMYDTRGDTVAPILEIYQRLRGVFVQNEKKNHLTVVRPVGLTLMAVIMLSSFGAAVWVYLKRSSTVVKASQPPFLWLICVGTAVMGSSIYTLGVDDSMAHQRGCDAACMITPWLLCLGFSITFAALTSKILRLKILMNNAAKFKRITVKVQDVLLPFCLIIIVNGALLLAWTLADPARWERVEAGRTVAGEVESFGRCVSDGKVSNVMYGLLITVNILALLVANVLAYQTRNLTVSFHEGRYVNFAMFAILEAVLIGMPILGLVDSNPQASYLMTSLVIFFLCMSVLLFMFIPKFWMFNLIEITSRTGNSSNGSHSRLGGVASVNLNRGSCICGGLVVGKQGIRISDGMTPWEIATCGDGPDGNGLSSMHSLSGFSTGTA